MTNQPLLAKSPFSHTENYKSPVLPVTGRSPLFLKYTVGTGGGLRLLVLLAAFVVAFLVQLPTSYQFANFVYYDPGVSLRTDSLIAQGYVPTTDFGYPYGLLPLIVGRAFFTLTGRTPAGYLAFMFLSELAIVFGLWRLASRWSWPAVCFLAAALPHSIIPVYLHLTHPLEAALIIHAIADLAAGRRARALAVATACIFVKPSMTYGLGLLLIIWVVVHCVRERKPLKEFFLTFLPALFTGVVCSLATIAYFGFRPLIDTLLPIVGAKSYVALDFGLFGNGRTFWWPDLTGVAAYARYYFYTPAGFWIICTIVVACFGLTSLIKLRRRATNKHEVLVTIAACHFFFIFVFFGWPGSWTYYSYLLVAGVATGLVVYRARTVTVIALTLLALFGHVETYRNTLNAWQWAKRSPETAGLYAYPDQREEWVQVRAIAGNREVFYLNNDCAELLFPGVSGPVSFFLSPDMQTPVEFERIRRQIEKSSVVVTFNQGPILDPWYWPEFANQREAFVETWKGRYLTIHERKQR